LLHLRTERCNIAT